MRIHPSIALALTFVLACGGDAAAPHAPLTGDDAARLYWALTLDHEAAMLSTAPLYDTLRITATPRDAQGRPLEGLGPVTYYSDNPEQVTVDAGGLVRALAPAQQVIVVAELTAGGVTRSDRLMVRVTDDPAPPTLVDLSVGPQPPDSTRWAAVTGDGTNVLVDAMGNVTAFGWKALPSFGTDANGLLVPGVLSSIQASDTTIFQAYNGASVIILLGRRPGRATVVARTTAYGAELADTVEFAITMPIVGAVKIQRDPGSGALAMSPREIVVGPGGTVLWVNTSGEPADIVFDDPGAALEHLGSVSCAKGGVVDSGGSGDIPAFGAPLVPDAPLAAENCRSRRFLAPGVYPYHSPLTGATGRVVVSDGLDGV
jgi:plastocyanin